MKNIQSTLMNELGGFFKLEGLYVPYKDTRKEGILRTDSLEVFGNSFEAEIFDGDMHRNNRTIKGEFIQSENKEYIKFLKTNKYNKTFDLAYILEKNKRTPEFSGIEGSYQGRWGKLKGTYDLNQASKDFFKELSFSDLYGPREARLKISRNS